MTTETTSEFLDVLDLLSKPKRTPQPEHDQNQADQASEHQAEPPPAVPPSAAPTTQVAAPAALEPYTSPTLSALAVSDAKRRALVRTVCAGCREALWLGGMSDLRAYCRVMHTIVWELDDRQEWTACDGEAIGTADYLAKQLD